MANVFPAAGYAPLADIGPVVYPDPSGATITGLHLTNTDSVAHTVRVKVITKSVFSDILPRDMSIAAGNCFILTQDIQLAGDDRLSITADAGEKVFYVVFGK